MKPSPPAYLHSRLHNGDVLVVPLTAAKRNRLLWKSRDVRRFYKELRREQEQRRLGLPGDDPNAAIKPTRFAVAYGRDKDE